MTESNQGEVALRNAGMLADDNDGNWDEIDRLFSGRPAAVKFGTQGDMVAGTVERAYTQVATEWNTKEPKLREDGTQIKDPVIELRPLGGGDLMSLYVSSWRMRNALQQAFIAAKVRGPRPGGTLAVRYVADEASGGANPAKVYEAAYDPPAGTGAKSVQAELPPVAAPPDAPPSAVAALLEQGDPPF